MYVMERTEVMRRFKQPRTSDLPTKFQNKLALDLEQICEQK